MDFNKKAREVILAHGLKRSRGCSLRRDQGDDLHIKSHRGPERIQERRSWKGTTTYGGGKNKNGSIHTETYQDQEVDDE